MPNSLFSQEKLAISAPTDYPTHKVTMGASAYFETALIFEDEYAAAYYLRAKARFHTGEFKAALIDLNQAVKLASKWADAYADRGTIHQNLGRLDQALAGYNLELSN